MYVGVDNPQVKHALKELSECQSYRMYSSNSTTKRFSSAEHKRSKSVGHVGLTTTKATAVEETSSVTSDQKRTSSANKKYQQFLDVNRKNFELDRSDYDIYGPDERTCMQPHYNDSNNKTKRYTTAMDDGSESITSGQISSDNSERPIIYNQPRPPRGKKPEIKKKLNSQRMSRYVQLSFHGLLNVI